MGIITDAVVTYFFSGGPIRSATADAASAREAMRTADEKADIATEALQRGPVARPSGKRSSRVRRRPPVDHEFCFFYSHEAAAEMDLRAHDQIRGAWFESVESFCDVLINALGRLFPKESRPRVIVRCRTKSNVQAVAAELFRRGLTVVAVHERFGVAHGTHLRRRVPNPEVEEAQFWVHQNKLIEGVDDPRFRLVAFFEPFSSERAFVQQIGRVLRNPGQKACLGCCVRQRQSSGRGLLHGPLNPYSRSRPQADGLPRFQPGGPLPVRHLLE